MPTPPLPITRRGFLLSFVFLCFLFLPVPFFAVVAISIAPVSALLPFAYGFGWNGGLVIVLAYAMIYIGIFYLLGAVCYRLAGTVPWRKVQWGFLIGILMVPLLCSFARVCTDGRKPPYTFWEGASRLLKR